jgi:uncharacterized protein (TIGR02145 family)
MYLVTVEGGNGATGGGNYSERETITISAGTAEDGKKFKNWTASNGGVSFADANKATTTFKMPAGDVTVTAVFEGTSGPVTPPSTDSTTPPVTPAKYAVVVSSEGKDATGGGDYVAGDTVWISAGTAPSGKQFKNWTTTSDGVTFTGANNRTTTFIMPANDVTVTAVFETQTVVPTMFALTVISAGTGAKGADNYVAGAAVTISAGTAPDGMQFKEWTSNSNVVFADENSQTTMFSMPENAVTVTANFVAATKYAVTVSSAGVGSSGGGDYAAGQTVRISAGTAPDGKRFQNWTTSSSGVSFANAGNAATTFTMPGNAVTVLANFEMVSTPTAKYTVIVTGGTGGGNYAKGETVSITAAVPSGQQFYNWTTTSSGVTFANANSSTTTFVMLGNAVTVTANFVTAPTYESVTIGGKKWMKKNLNIETADSWCYENSRANCDKYGRLYTWEAAKKACPSGWHLPSRAEWGTLAKAAGGTGTYGDDGTAGKALKATSGWYGNGNGTDAYGFSALPGGSCDNYGYFYGAGYYGDWWTATEIDSGNAYFRSMFYNDDYVSEIGGFIYGNKSDGYSVRCVQN